ncbi:MAG: PAS domain-containing protein [Bacteroidota bacterium]|nr:PAS domain-containing protein [Bacteroidota bacterium]
MTNTVTSKTKEQLIIDNEELHFRLLEAKEMLSAIRSGEVDAIVISGAEGEQVYSLSSSETPYRTFVEEMHGGAVTLNKEGLILYCNNSFAELVKQPVKHVIGSYFKDYIIAVDKLKLENLLEKLPSRKNKALIISLTNSTWLKLSVRLLPAYLHGDNFIIIATDITALKQKEIELLKLHRQIKQHLVQVKDLRLDIINAKIDTDAVNKKLEKIAEKLIKENSKLRMGKEELKLKLKQKKVSERMKR